MKNRLIVAAIGIPALLAVIFFTPIWGWGIVVAIMASFCACRRVRRGHRARRGVRPVRARV